MGELLQSSFAASMYPNRTAHVDVEECVAAFELYMEEVKIIAREAGVEDQLDFEDDDDD